jgi:hypothetical protein
MSKNEGLLPTTAAETLGEFPPREALQLLACEYEKASKAAPDVSVLTIEDLERLRPTRDRELILGLA